MLAVPFGERADAVMIWVILLCFGLLVWLTYRLGATLFHPWVGIVTASSSPRAPRSSATR